MTLSLYVTLEASQNADDIAEYLEERNPAAASRFAQAFEETAEMLCNNPELGEQLRADPTGQIRYCLSGTRPKAKHLHIFFRPCS